MLEFSVSATTRKQRPGEVDGKDYYFITVEDFKNHVANDEFVEYEEVYPGTFYGTLRSEAGRIWAKEHHVVFDVDVVGGKNLKDMYGDKALLMFIKLPSFETLEHRLRSRSTETAEQLNTRLDKARHELEYEVHADVIVVNDVLEVAQKKALTIVSEFITQ